MSAGRGSGGDDGRSPVVRSAERGAHAWRTAVHEQRSAELDHSDFYALAAELVDTLRVVEEVLCDLAVRADLYADAVPAGQRVYDDTRTVDPRTRLAEAAGALRAAVRPLRSAEAGVDRYWSAVGHIGVQDAGDSR